MLNIMKNKAYKNMHASCYGFQLLHLTREMRELQIKLSATLAGNKKYNGRWEVEQLLSMAIIIYVSLYQYLEMIS